MLRLFTTLPIFLLSLALSAVVQAQSQDQLRLLTSIKPLQLIAAAMQDGLGTPDVLLPPGASPHHYALRPSDVRQIRDADLLYWVGPDLESFLPKVLAGRDKASVAVQSLEQMTLRHFGDSHTEHEHEHQRHQENALHADHNHRPGALDAHLWLMPANALVIAMQMAADLSRLDPTNAARYQANLQAFTERLAALDKQLRERLEPLKGKPYFVFHEAYDYFEAAYGLKHAGVFSVLTEIQPGARHVAAMRQRLQQAGPSCVFSEPPLRPRLAETLTSGLPVTLAELDAMGGELPVDARGYEGLLENLVEGLVACLGPL